VIVRAATAADAEAVAAVYLASFKAHVPATLTHTDDEVRGWIVGLIDGPPEVTVALDGSSPEAPITAMAATTVHDGVSWVDALYVAPDRLGAGFGRGLLADALARLPRPVRLWTFTANARARRFYESHGFVAIEFGDGSGNEEGEPDVLYELS
jgi:GNAT superfamily N-acetyltransferase